MSVFQRYDPIESGLFCGNRGVTGSVKVVVRDVEDDAHFSFQTVLLRSALTCLKAH